VTAELRDAAKLQPQPAVAIPSLQSPFGDAPMTPRLTPRMPGKADVAKMTPRVPSGGGGDMTARRLMADSPHGATPKSPQITTQQLSPLPTKTLSYLSKKLVHLSVMLEQDTVLSDTAYPTFAR